MQNPDETNVLGQKKFATPSLSTKNKKRQYLERIYSKDEAISYEAQKFYSMLRIDKSLAFHLKDITYPNHCNRILFLELIYFFSCRHKLNLFNSTEFHLADFAKQWRYSIDYLQRTHPAIESGALKPFVDEDKIVYKSIFDVTLHQLLNTFFKVDKVTNSNDGTRVSEKLRYFIIEYLRIVENKRTNKKRTYLATLSKAFVENLAKNYQNIDVEDYIKICSGDGTNKGRETLSFLYILFSYWHQKLSIHQPFTPNFEELCDFCGIQAVRPAKRKETLAKALEKLSKSTFMPFEYHFVKTNKQRYSYSLIINFLYEPVEEPEKARLLFDILKKESFLLYTILHPQKDNAVVEEREKYHLFEIWRTDPNCNSTEKQQLLSELTDKLKRGADVVEKGLIDNITNHYFGQVIDFKNMN